MVRVRPSCRVPSPPARAPRGRAGVCGGPGWLRTAATPAGTLRGVLAGLLAWLLALASPAAADPLPREAIAALVMPPFSVGEPVNDRGVWQLLNSGGAHAGYVFETEPLAPLPGFSGSPINVLVTLDLAGNFLDARLISHNEPIFVSGLGEAPFHKFFEQYRGHSIATPMVVGSPYGTSGAGSGLVALDGVTKATASVRVAHESILAATLAVAREKMQGVASAPPAAPDPDHDEALTWDDLVAQGIARNLRVTNAEVDKAFAGTRFADADPEAAADPAGLYLDLWLIDIGPPAVARAVLDRDGLRELERLRRVAPQDEPLLVIDAGRHGLVSADFVRNTAPDRLTAVQDGLPVALRDADLVFDTAPGVPLGAAMVLRTDRRLGFDPTRDWVLQVQAVRTRGSFQPEVGSVHLDLVYAAPERFFLRAEPPRPLPPWREALWNRRVDLLALAAVLGAVFLLLGPGEKRLVRLAAFRPARLAILAGVTAFVGYWGQGQLSIVTVLGAIRAAWDGASFAFLLYDPFSLMVWAAAGIGFVLWGRGLFCGWLCPFGALQEFAHHAGRALRLPVAEPSAAWDRRLKSVKYLLLAGLVATVFLAPGQVDTVAELEPFKTAITTHFVRPAPYVAYAVAWLVLGAFTFRGFCRYVCPLGAVMVLGGLLRRRDWIARRADCGAPCQLCRVRCRYGAISRSGRVEYAECFQCLDCVKIHDDPGLCVPRVLAARGRRGATAVPPAARPIAAAAPAGAAAP